MSDGGSVIVDADELLKRIDRVRDSVNDLSTFLAEHLTTRPPTPTVRRQMEKVSSEGRFVLNGFDIYALDWKLKSGDPAGSSAGWSWAFSMDPEGFVLDEARILVEAIEKYGPEIIVGEYAVKLSGRGQSLLSRRRLKK